MSDPNQEEVRVLKIHISLFISFDKNKTLFCDTYLYLLK